MSNKFTFKITPTRIVLIILAIAGMASGAIRFALGLGATTNMNDMYPWAFWIGFDVMTGVALAAGGFTTAAVVYIFNNKKYYSLARPAILTGLLGYILVIVGLIFDLGRPWVIYHPLFMPQIESVMFEVAICVMLYTTVLAVEFSPVVFEKFKMKRAYKIAAGLTIPFVILGIILSTLHQSSLGALFLLFPSKLHALWWTENLPYMFYLSALAVGPAMVIVESTLAHNAFQKKQETDLLANFAKAIPILLGLYLILKIWDLSARGGLHLMFQGTYEANMFLVELIIGVIVPGIILTFYRFRHNHKLLFTGALMVVLGVFINRMNIALVGMSRATGESYFPSVIEILVSVGIVAIGVLVYTFISENFRVLPDDEHH